MELRWTDVKNGALIEYLVGRDGALHESYVHEVGWHKMPASSPDLIRKMHFERELSDPRNGPILRAVLEALHKTVTEIEEIAQNDPRRAFAHLGSNGKPVLAIDMVAECNIVRRVREGLERFQYRGPRPLVLGEESLDNPRLDVSGFDGPMIEFDALDGSDELEQGFSGWCSTATVSLPSQGRIVGAFVAQPSKWISFAMGSLVAKCRFRDNLSNISPEVRNLDGPSDVTTIENSLLTFYGHKPNRQQAMRTDPRYLSLLQALSGSKRTRIRTEGGAPMLVRIVDGAGRRRVDAVFDLLGQAPHDMVPGTYIAQRAGATLCDLSGQPIDLASLLRRPADPNSRVPYICAATPELALALCSYLSDQRAEPGHRLQLPPPSLEAHAMSLSLKNVA